MGRPTLEKTLEMNCRKLVKNIWEEAFDRPRTELKVSLGHRYIKIEAGGDYHKIHRSFFEDYFSPGTNTLKTMCLESIKKSLEQCYKSVGKSAAA